VQTETQEVVSTSSRRGRQGAPGAPEGQHTQVGLAAGKDQAEPEPAAGRARDAIRQPRQPGYQRLPLPRLARPPRRAVGGRTRPGARAPRSGTGDAGTRGFYRRGRGGPKARTAESNELRGPALGQEAVGPGSPGDAGFRAWAAGAAGARRAAGAVLILCLPWSTQGHTPCGRGPAPGCAPLWRQPRAGRRGQPCFGAA